MMTFKQSPPGFQNVHGPLIQGVQLQLNAAGFDAGVTDGVWGSHTLNALRGWQQSEHLAVNGVVDEPTWTSLMASPIPALSARALQLTGDWEGTGYSLANGNFDGQGITWGIVGFTWGNGELQGILRQIHTQYPAIFSAAFGQAEAQMVSILQQPLASQMSWARTISTNAGNSIVSPWKEAFAALGDQPEVQEIENTHAQHYWLAGERFADDFGLQSDLGLALCFDIAVQNIVTDAMIAEIQAQNNGGSLLESDKMRVVAHVVASHANPKYYLDVLTRKMTFVTGQGTVHGARYDVSCWGLA